MRHVRRRHILSIEQGLTGQHCLKCPFPSNSSCRKMSSFLGCCLQLQPRDVELHCGPGSWRLDTENEKAFLLLHNFLQRAASDQLTSPSWPFSRSLLCVGGCQSGSCCRSCGSRGFIWSGRPDRGRWASGGGLTRPASAGWPSHPTHVPHAARSAARQQISKRCSSSDNIDPDRSEYWGQHMPCAGELGPN